jgi:hypothetical protein
MKTRDFISITTQLSKELPGFVIKGSLMFLPPVKDLLRGIYFEPSATAKRAFYVTVFVLPLYVPTEHLYFNLGKRIGIGWDADSADLIPELAAALEREALPFLKGFGSVLDLAEAMPIQNSPDPYTQQAIAYGFAPMGKIEQALGALDRLLTLLDVKVPWQHDLAERAESLRSALTENPSEAQHRLEAWEADTVKHLGLEDFR